MEALDTEPTQTLEPIAGEAGGAATAPDGEELAERWHELLGRYHRTSCALDRALTSEHDLTVSEFEALQQLQAVGGKSRMHELAEQVHLTQSAFSRLVTRIEEAGLVTRCVCPDDRRAAFVEITEAGERRYLEAKPTHRDVLLSMAGEPGDALHRE